MTPHKILERLYKFRVIFSFGVAMLAWQLGDPLIQPTKCNDGFVPIVYGIINRFGPNVCTNHRGIAENWSGDFVAAASFAVGLFVWLWLAEWNNIQRSPKSATDDSKLSH
jgi:hypothetical protein